MQEEVQSYKLFKDDNEFIIKTQLINDALRIECQDKNIPEYPIYTKIYTLWNFKDLDNFFQPYNSVKQILDELNNAIEQQSLTIETNQDNTLSIIFYLKNKINSAEVTLKLPKERNQTQNEIQNKKEAYNFEFQGRCSCPLDNERIDKLEIDSGKLQKDHEFLRNEINILREKINGLNSRINKLKNDNLQLNQKTMKLKEENNSRRIEANQLRENNEAIKRQNQQLREKKNRLEFLLKEHHDQGDTILNCSANQPFQNYNITKSNMDKQMYPLTQVNNNNNGIDRQILINEEGYNDPNNSDTKLSRGTIIREENELKMLINKINKNNMKMKFNLIYKASDDSDKASAFHSNCDQAEKTLVLVETTKGRRFGGYTECSWKGDCIDKKDPNAFVFSLDKMEIYKIIPEKNAIGCYPNFGPVFLGCQIKINDNAFSAGGTTFEKGITYMTNENYELSGEKMYGIKEIEVYEVKTS